MPKYIERTEAEKRELAEQICEYLNELLEIDPHVVTRLTDYRIACNDELREHPTVQVAIDEGVHKQSVGLLGILNGFVGTKPDGWGYIVAIYGDSQNEEGGDLRLLGFQVGQ